MLPANPPSKNVAATAKTTMPPHKQHCLHQNNNTLPKNEDTVPPNKDTAGQSNQMLPMNPSPKSAAAVAKKMMALPKQGRGCNATIRLFHKKKQCPNKCCPTSIAIAVIKDEIKQDQSRSAKNSCSYHDVTIAKQMTLHPPKQQHTTPK